MMALSVSAVAMFSIALGGGCAIPGPSTTAVVARALSRGVAAALPLCAGLLLGDLFWCGLSVFGASALLAQMHPVSIVLRYAGATYLAWLAWRLWNARPAATTAASTSDGVARSVFGGLAVALANPKTMLFYLAMLPAIIDTSNVATHEFALVALVTTVVYGGVLIAYALAAAAARHRFDSPRQMQRIRRVSSVIIAMSALLIVIR